MSENKHNAWDLAQMQSLPLSAKIQMTKRRIIDWYEYWDGQVYVSISGGKDSQVLAHIVKSIYPDVPLVFVNTGLEYDSVRLKGQELADVVLRPEIDFVNVIKKYGYPIISKEVSNNVDGARKYIKILTDRQTDRQTGFRIPTITEEWLELGNIINQDWGKVKGSPQRLAIMLGMKGKKKAVIPSATDRSQYNMEKYSFLLNAPFRISDKCCDAIKKKTTKNYEKENHQKAIIGTMAEESKLRKQKWMKYGCNAFDKGRPSSQPLSFWTEQDILHYIKKYQIEIASIYGDVVYTDDDGMFYDEPLFNDSMKLTTTGANRTGCVFCMFGITYDTEKFLRLKEAEPTKYDYVMRGGKFDEQGMWIPDKGLGYKFVIDWLNEHGNLGIKY